MVFYAAGGISGESGASEPPRMEEKTFPAAGVVVVVATAAAVCLKYARKASAALCGDTFCSG